MRALPVRYERLPKPVVYTFGLTAVGVAYPVTLVVLETAPTLEALDPYLAAGALLGFALDRLLGPGGLVALVEGNVGRRWLESPREAAAHYEPFGLLETPAKVEDLSADAWGATDHEERDEDDDSGFGLWSLYSLGSLLGATSWLQFTATWFVGLVLGTLWILVAIRLLRFLSPFSEAAAWDSVDGADATAPRG